MKNKINSEIFAEILQLIIKIHNKYPELRFGQLLENVCGANDCYYLSNEQMLELITDYYEEIK